MKNLRPFFLIGICLTTISPGFAADRAKGDKPERVAFGREIKLEDYLVPGKTVIFDFTSQFCPPCRQIAPHLDRLHEQREDIVVVAVDINRPDVKGIDWKSPVARQYRISSVPQFKVYGADGKLMAERDEAKKMVLSWLDFSGS